MGGESGSSFAPRQNCTTLNARLLIYVLSREARPINAELDAALAGAESEARIPP
jgi:hypothetical protein